ncbi:MAG TPA: hypothetical protein VI386_17775 [Candidatus Sulfotelmatobacter sp.]
MPKRIGRTQVDKYRDERRVAAAELCHNTGHQLTILRCVCGHAQDAATSAPTPNAATSESEEVKNAKVAAKNAGYGSGSLASVITNLTILCSSAKERAEKTEAELSRLREAVEKKGGE